MLANVLLYGLLLLAARVLPLIPLRWAYRLADLAGLLAFYLVPPARRGICANLAVVTGLPEGSAAVRGLARKAFANDAKNWIDTLRIRRVRHGEVERSLRLEGWERVVEALQAGKGAIIVTMHLGNFDLVGQVVTERGYRLVVPVERMRPAVLFRRLTEARESRGIKLVPTRQAPREMLHTLRDGGIVGLAGDRGPAKGSVMVSLCGRPARLPRAAAALARRTGAPVLLGVGIRQDDGTYLGFVRGPLEMVRTDQAERDERINVQRIAHAMEEFLQRFPEQWLAFSPVWGSQEQCLDTMGRPTEAGV